MEILRAMQITFKRAIRTFGEDDLSSLREIRVALPRLRILFELQGERFMQLQNIETSE